MNNTKMNILVVEDNLTAAKVAKIVLEQLGCASLHAEDGEQALKLFKENHFDGICMDIGLPTISGTEVCIAIREYEALNHLTPVPIVAVTGNNSPAEREKYIKAGMQDVMDKPFTKEKAVHLLSFCK